VRVLNVRYRVTVYAEVDLDAGEVTRVSEDVESIRLDLDQPRPSRMPWQVQQDDRNLGDAIEPSYGPNGEESPFDGEITPEIAARALDIAKGATWPMWES